MEDPSRTSYLWHHPAPRSVEAAILCSLAYADIFDYPLTASEIHRYLVGMQADLPTIDAALNHGRTPGNVIRSGAYFTLPGREPIVNLRCQRTLAAEKLWPEALRSGRAIAHLPFVRMVAVTGALAVDNAGSGDDIDYLVVTAPDRLWLCRAMIIQFVVKPAARRGVNLCPNYLLSERALTLFDHNLFTAHEIVQMVPIAGLEIYRQLCMLNPWVAEFLPNAYGRPRTVHGDPAAGRGPLVDIEPVLRSSIGGPLERWEMERKIRRFAGERPDESEASFSSEWCKGHFENHSRFVHDHLFRRLASLGEQGCQDAAS